MDGEQPKPEEAAEGAPAEDDDDEESGEEEMKTEEIQPLLLEACRENNYDKVDELLKLKNCEVVYEIDGWSPILWAACNGNEDICRLLIAKNACAPYMNQNKAMEGSPEN